MNELNSLIILNRINGLGSVTIRKLVKRFGSASAVLQQNRQSLKSHGCLSDAVISNFYNFDRDAFLKGQHDLMRKHTVHPISYRDEGYPRFLKEITDPPVVIYVKGVLPSPVLPVAIVGSRHASVYGINTAERLACDLAQRGFTIVSGLARGVDAAAHRGCLKAGGTTIAVVGCGLDHVYPQSNKELFQSIAKTGAVISEFPLGTPPVSYNFPRRNRVISGLSLGVIVVEAAQRSGALITSRFALEYGREVFAVPGKIDHPNARGVNQLIKEGAKLVACCNDVIEELYPQAKEYLKNVSADQLLNEKQKCENKNIAKNLSEEERTVYNCISDTPTHIDVLSARIKERCCAVSSVLLKLEINRFIKQLPGKYFVRCA